MKHGESIYNQDDATGFINSESFREQAPSASA
jgi:hypothetical protein